ncbi:MAG: restriction endonuclease subunit S [Candidatus Electrothrix sp. ATG1]|nr:restriction endonuclease subunit S [Candidatus Electrothrix sp. ATG1]
MDVSEGYKQTEVGVLPEDWEVQPVSEAYEIKNNLRLPISKKVRETMEGIYPYYGPTNIQGYINEYRVEGEHALIGEDGDHFLKWRNMPMTLLVDGKFNVNNHAHVVKGVNNSTRWFHYYFSHRDITKYLARQGAGRYKLNKKTLETIPCVVPTKAEQEAIAEALSDADALIESLGKLIAKKRQIKQGAMQELLTGRRRLPGFEGAWKSYKLGELAKLFNGRAFSLFEWEESGTPVIRLQNLTGRGEVYYYSNLILPEKQYCEAGDLLFMWSATFGPIIWKGPKAIYHYHIWKIECHQNKLDKNYLFHYLSDVTEKLKENSTSGGTMLHLTKSGMETMVVTAPEFKEQEAIAKVLNDIDEEITALEAKQTKARKIKQGMMQELLTGRVRLVRPAPEELGSSDLDTHR